MRRRLFFECVRRVLPLCVAGALFICGIGIRQVALLSEDTAVGISGVLACAMALSWILGLSPGAALRQREIVQLPVSRRDIWIVRWWLAVTVAPVTVTLANLIGVATHHFFNRTYLAPREVALIAACSVVWAGLTMISWPSQWPGLKPLDRLPPNSAARKLTGRLLIAAITAWFVAGLGLPFLLAPAIARAAAAPTKWSYAVAVGLALLILSRYFHTPPITERPPAARALRRDVTNETTAVVAPSTQPTLTGLRFMYWREARRCLLLVGIALAAVVGYWWLFESGPRAIGADSTTQTFAGFLRAYWLLPFEGRGTEPPTVLMMVIVFMLASSANDTQRVIRRLRTLPFSSWTLSMALWLRVMIAPVVLWTAAVLLHVLVLHTLPETPKLGVMLLLLGLFATEQAISLAAAGKKGAGAIVFGTLGILTVQLGRVLSWSEWTFAAVGVIALAGSLWLSDWAIRRRSRLYAKYAGPMAVVESRFN